MSERVVFHNDLEQLFRSHGLGTVEDFFAYTGGRVINRNSKRQVLAFTLDADPARQFFMKRFFRPHLKDMLFSFGNVGRPCSQGHFECDNALTLRRHGLASFVPVCFGEIMRLGFEEKSFLVSEKLPHQCLSEFVEQNWATFSAEQKQSLVSHLAVTIRRLHDARISLPDLYLYHIYIRPTDNNYEFAFIDLHRMARNVICPTTRIKDLGAFVFSLGQPYFDELAKRAFVAAYAPEKSPGSLDRLYARINARAGALARRRSPRPRLGCS